MIERFEAKNSPLHRLDPRVKVMTALVMILGILMTPERAWPAYPLLWAIIGSLAMIGEIGAGRLARLGSLALPFALAALTLLFTTPGHQISGLPITDAGLARFVAILLKSWLAVQMALLLSLTTHFTDLLWALSSLRVPPTLIEIISFMYRYLFTLHEEAERLMRARMSRSGKISGSQPGGRLIWRAQVAGGMVGSLFLRSYERSEQVYAAMLSRGYSGQIIRSARPILTWNAIYTAAIPILLLILIQIAARLWWAN